MKVHVHVHYLPNNALNFTVQNGQFQSTTALGIAAYNGAGKFKHNNLSPPTGSPFIHLGPRAAMWMNCLAEGQKCRGDGEIRTRALSERVQ